MGLESGVVEEFTLARDYNRLDSTRVYHAHDKVGFSRIAIIGNGFLMVMVIFSRE